MLTDSILRMAEGGKRTMFVEQGVYRSRRFGYAEVIERALAFSGWLRDQGRATHQSVPTRGSPRPVSGGGDNDLEEQLAAPPVVLWARPGARWAMAFYGCVLAGAVVAPVDAGFSSDFVRNVIQHTGASLLILDGATEKRFEESKVLTNVPHCSLEGLENLSSARPIATPAPRRETLLEIVYTSGTTSQPRGVMITHGNLLANLEPIEKEIRRYEALSVPFRPLRFLHLIPLSHLFGQVMGLFIPQLLQAEVIFPESQAPAQLARIMRERRVSVMVSVPQQLEALGAWAAQELGGDWRQEIERSQRERWAVWKRWWRFRRAHRALGWKMWAFVVGGARLPASVEALWNALGYAVVQGYGLTETAPAISITHPFKIRRGAVGRPLAGVETRIAADGEILVRGANVSPGYFGDPAATRAVFSDGWLHTGDLGKFDEAGNLIYLGRKKEMIVTAEGLNVFPEDVERVLLEQPAVREAAVVGKEAAPPGPGEPPSARTVVHAVIVPAEGSKGEEIETAVEQANRSLEPHQRVRGFSLWPGESLPRTLTTGKMQRAAIAAWVNAAAATAAAPLPPAQEAADWRRFLVRLGVPADRLRSEARLAEDLGLSSLDRVELMTWMEGQGYPVSEEWMAQATTVADIEKAVRARTTSLAEGVAHSVAPGAGKGRPQARPERRDLQSEPRWTVSAAAAVLRDLLQRVLVFPLLRYYVKPEFRGLERLRDIPSPALFVANHESFFDAALIQRALPWRWRRRLAPAMSGEAFRAHSRFSLFLTRLIFNGYLISQNPARAQEALRRAGWLAERGYSTLIFPEGERTPDGKLQPFHPGVAVMAERLGLPVVTLHIEGLYAIWPRSNRRPRRGRASVTIGETFRLGPGESAAAFAQRLENYYRAWSRSCPEGFRSEGR